MGEEVRTVHEIWHVNDCRHALGIRVGQRAAVLYLPAKRIGQDDDSADRLGTGVGARDIGWDTVNGLLGPCKSDITAQRALETIGARHVVLRCCAGVAEMGEIINEGWLGGSREISVAVFMGWDQMR